MSYQKPNFDLESDAGPAACVSELFEVRFPVRVYLSVRHRTGIGLWGSDRPQGSVCRQRRGAAQGVRSSEAPRPGRRSGPGAGLPGAYGSCGGRKAGERFGFSILAAFDDDPAKQRPGEDPPVLPVSRLSAFCRARHVVIGIITVPEAKAQKVCDAMLAAGITEIWNFAPCRLSVPEGVTVQQENLALSVANLHMCAKRSAHRISPTEQKGTHDEGTELSDC